MAAVGVVVAFASLLYLSIRGVPLSVVMFVSSAVMALTSGMPADQTLKVFWEAFSEKATLELAAAVLSIGVFSTVMRDSGLLDRTVAGLTAVLGNVKAAVMAVPALIGTMPVLGGAALSAPLVDKLGDRLGISHDTKAAANLVFRHGMFFVFPFSTGLVLTSKLTGFTVPQLVGRMWPISVALWGIGYFALLRKTPRSGRAEQEMPASYRESAASSSSGGGPVERSLSQPSPDPGHESRLTGLSEFLFCGGPLLLALGLGIALSLPLWLALSIGTAAALAIALTTKKPLPSRRALLKGANLGQVTAMFWIMAFKSFIELTPVFRSAVDKATANGISPALLALLLPLAFGYANASQTATISVLIPIFVTASYPEAVRLGFTALIYGSSFIAYFFSPLHMCQVLTCQYYGVGLSEVYKKNWPVLVGFLAILCYMSLMLTKLL